jgi:GTPase SAR1 family protein
MNGVLTNILLWDYSSQEKFRSMVYQHLEKKADLLVLAFDCTDRFTFEAVPGTIKMLSDRGIIIKNKSILISTKCDVDQERKKVTEEEARVLQK